MLVEKIDKKTGEVEKISFARTSLLVTVKMEWGEMTFKSTRTKGNWGAFKDSRPGASSRKCSDLTIAELFRELNRVVGTVEASQALIETHNQMQSPMLIG